MKKYLFMLILLSLSLISYSFANEKVNTSISFEEITHVDNHFTGNHFFSHIVLKLIPKCYPTNTLLELRVHRAAYRVFEIFHIKINDDGSITSINDGFGKDESPFSLILCNPLLGECFDFSLTMVGNSFYDSNFRYTPYPIELMDESGHKVTLRLIDFEKGKFCIEGSGYNDYENIQIRINIGMDEKIMFERVNNGNFCQILPDLYYRKDPFYQYATISIEISGEDSILYINLPGFGDFNKGSLNCFWLN